MKVLVTGGSGFIGTNMVSEFIARGDQVLNIDIAAPKLANLVPSWCQLDIMDQVGLREVVGGFDPEVAIHLAARTDADSDEIDDYRVNFLGTEHLVRALASAPSLSRFVHTSTQFVSRPGRQVTSDVDFDPHTAYGRSKVLSELALRAVDPAWTWTIVRPTNIWGPWHPRYPYEFWHALSRGLYLHPRGRQAVRTYGYVKNAISQIIGIVQSPHQDVHRRVFYIGDRQIELREWTNAFSLALTGRNVREVPRWLLYGIATLGDLSSLIGVTAPLTRSRLSSMTSDYESPVLETIRLLGEPPVSLLQGVAETSEWLQEYGFVKEIHTVA